MPSPEPSQQSPAPGLPPVTPPSGRFIAQLFFVPGMIVMVVVLLVLGMTWIASSGNTPERFLKSLDSNNVDIRWRAASDLAQVLEKSPTLKMDTAFALEIAQRLRGALDELQQQEKTLAEKTAKLSPDEREKAWRKLGPQRDFVDFLAADLGHFYAPVGVPLLCEIITREDSPDLKGNTLMRRKAIWALANLGNQTKNARRELSDESRGRIVETLKEEIRSGKSPRAAWAATALHYLDSSASLTEAPAPVRVDAKLAECAKSSDRYLREHVAMALNFWDGPLVEETLLQLTRDDGFGTLIRVEEGD